MLSSDVNVASTSTRGRGRKRNTRENDSTEHRKPAKRARMKKGALRKLIEMPMDVIYEIFGRLEPLDLLRVARTTKGLRSILMSRSSVSIWKSARSNVFGLPDCPDDLSEPQYATLMFVTECSFCQRGSPVIEVCWYGRVRYCKKCIKSNFTPITPVPERGCYERYRRGYPTLLADWVPLIKMIHEVPSNDSRGTSMRHETLILESTDKQWKNEYLAIKDPKSQYEWLFRKLESRYVIQKHAHACLIWHNACIYGGNDEMMQKIFERDAQITDIVKKTRPDIFKLPPTLLDVLESIYYLFLWGIKPRGPGFAEFTPFNEGFICLSLNTNVRMISNATQLHGLEYLELFELRKHVLSEIYDKGIKALPINSPYPTLAQTFCITEDHGLMDYSEDALRVPFGEVVALWRKHVDSKLIKLITNACGPEYTFDPTTVFDLATTFFVCCHCRPFRPLSHDQAMVHPCGMSIDLLNGNDTSQEAFRRAFGSAVWGDVDGSVQFSKAHLKVMQEIIERCGLDPKVTTARQMNELDPIFECRTCNVFEKGRATMSWTAVLGHQLHYHNRNYQEIRAMTVLGEPEASKVRERIKEEQARTTYQQRVCQIVCPHCRSVLENLKLYREHLKKEHEISKFTYEEIVYSLQQDRIPPLYRLWPPLDEESSEA